MYNNDLSVLVTKPKSYNYIFRNLPERRIHFSAGCLMGMVRRAILWDDIYVTSYPRSSTQNSRHHNSSDIPFAMSILILKILVKMVKKIMRVHSFVHGRLVSLSPSKKWMIT